MSISLYNSMKLGKFSECILVAGHEGIDKVIENITIMEVPDIVKWLKGRELILTSLFAIKEDIDAQNLLIQRLHYAGATALAIKPFQSMESIPEGIIKSANKLGFPVIQIPDHVRYLDILSPVMHYIFNEKVVLQEDLEQATNVLQEISLNSQGADVFVENVSYITKNIVTIESQFSFIETSTPEQPISSLTKEEKKELSIIKRPIRYNRRYGEEIVPCIVAPIIVDGELYGNITCWAVNSEHLSMDLAILEKASSLLSLEFLRLKVKYDIEQQYKNDFMRELLFNETISEKNLSVWGEKFHIIKDKKYVCLLLNKKEEVEFKESNLLKKAEINSILQKHWPTSLVGNIRDWLCVITSIADDSVSDMCEEVYNKVSAYIDQQTGLCLGVGKVCDGPKGIRKSFLQAEQALKLTKNIPDSQRIIYYDDLGAYRLLGPLLGKKELVDFYEETIGKLMELDSKNDFIKTLKAFFYHNEVLKITANALYIHVNTLKYRISRIEVITGCDLRNTEEKMNLFLGLKIYELLNYQKD